MAERAGARSRRIGTRERPLVDIGDDVAQFLADVDRTRASTGEAPVVQGPSGAVEVLGDSSIPISGARPLKVGFALSKPNRCAGPSVRVHTNRGYSAADSRISSQRGLWTGFVDPKWTCDQVPETFQAVKSGGVVYVVDPSVGGVGQAVRA